MMKRPPNIIFGTCSQHVCLLVDLPFSFHVHTSEKALKPHPFNASWAVGSRSPVDQDDKDFQHMAVAQIIGPTEMNLPILNMTQVFTVPLPP